MRAGSSRAKAVESLLQYMQRSEGAKDEVLVAMVKTALFAILAGGNEPEVNSRARAWAKKLVSKDALVAEVKHRKVQGANLASSWSLKALCSKVSA